jgi:FlaA1/EpsC-like NDP-sugar epimerase
MLAYDMICLPVKIRSLRMQAYPQSVEHLLKRKPLTTDKGRSRAAIEARTVLVTGAGGSIGSTLCRRIAQYHPQRLVLLDNSEHALYQIHDELVGDSQAGSDRLDGFERERNPQKTGATDLAPVLLAPVLGDISDSTFLQAVLGDWRPEIIFHAAAYKHVALLEYQPQAAIRNNAVGTYKLACAALEYGTRRLVMLSTDKAVNPASIMGASKRIAELAVAMTTADCKITSVRLGNVMGSQGSVVPRFLAQIKRRTHLTVTHPEAARYFLTPDEAADLVTSASWLGQGGDILVPDLGEPVRIVDLARTMIRASPYGCAGELDVVFTGLQPGEKLAEELLGEGENAVLIPESGMARILPLKTELRDLSQIMAELEALSSGRDTDALLDLVCRILPEYRPSSVLLNGARR